MKEIGSEAALSSAEKKKGRTGRSRLWMKPAIVDMRSSLVKWELGMRLQDLSRFVERMKRIEKRRSTYLYVGLMHCTRYCPGQMLAVTRHRMLQSLMARSIPTSRYPPVSQSYNRPGWARIRFPELRRGEVKPRVSSLIWAAVPSAATSTLSIHCTSGCAGGTL